MRTVATMTMMNPTATGLARIPRPTAQGGDGAGCALARRLGGYTVLDEQDRAALAGLIGFVRPVERRTILVEQDTVAYHAVIVFAGFASRDKHRASGRRQIVAYLVPGDLCDRGVLHDYPLGHTIETLTPCLVARVPRTAYLDLLGRHPRIALALQRARLIEEATAHEWLANIGMRSGTERTAHLLCELMERLGTVGQVTDGQYDLPLTQTDLADTLGLSSVHVNRVLQALRRDRLISLSGHRLRILAPRRLRELAEFDDGSL